MSSMRERSSFLRRREVLRLLLQGSVAVALGGCGASPAASPSTQSAGKGTLPTASTIITVEAKPGRISIDPSRTAVIVVDMQNDFGAKNGMFDRAGLQISEIQKAVGP